MSCSVQTASIMEHLFDVTSIESYGLSFCRQGDKKSFMRENILKVASPLIM